MTKVIAPNKQYSGISAGVTFVNGIGETADPHLISWFKDRGYEVEETEEPEGNGQEGTSQFDSMTLEELKAYAEGKGIDIGQSTSQKGILKKILEAEKVTE